MPAQRKRIDRGLWWDRALYATHGCRPRSEACEHCWAAQAAHMRAKNPNPAVAEINAGITDETGSFVGRVNLDANAIMKPFRTRKRLVWAIWDDLFYGDEEDEAWCEEHEVPFEPVPFSFAARVLEIVFGTPQHTYVLLTKRPKRMAEFFSRYVIDYGGDEPLVTYDPEKEARYLCAPDQWPLDNLVLGTTVESQEYWERLPALFQSPATRYTVSLEPLLGAVHLEPFLDKLDGVQLGGETGAKARPMNPYCVRAVRDGCVATGTKFFFKHWGEFAPTMAGEKADHVFEYPWYHEGDKHSISVSRVGRKRAGRLLDGRVWNDLPW